MAAPNVTRTEDEMFAAVAAGHEMAGMPLTDDDEAVVRRVLRGETTAAREIAALDEKYRQRKRNRDRHPCGE